MESTARLEWLFDGVCLPLLLNEWLARCPNFGRLKIDGMLLVYSFTRSHFKSSASISSNLERVCYARRGPHSTWFNHRCYDWK